MTGNVEYKNIVNKAVKEYNDKNYPAALECFKRISEINYRNLKIHELLSYTYLKLNNLEKAEEELNIIKQIQKYKNKTKKANETVFNKSEFIILKQKYRDIINQSKSLNFHEEMDVINKLSNYYMSVKKYKEAEKILTDYKNKFY